MLLSRRKDKESGIVYSGALHSDEKAQTTAMPAWINMKHIKSQKTPSVGSFSSDICDGKVAEGTLVTKGQLRKARGYD